MFKSITYVACFWAVHKDDFFLLHSNSPSEGEKHTQNHAFMNIPKNVVESDF